MLKITCDVVGCLLFFDSVLELKIHRLDNHYQRYFDLTNGDEVLLLRYMGTLK